MNILVIGTSHNLQECKAKFGGGHQYTLVTEHRDAGNFLNHDVLVFDFTIAEEPLQLETYVGKKTVVFFNTVKTSLTELTHVYKAQLTGTFFGFNGLLTFLDRPLLEASLLKEEDKNVLEQICKQLGTDFSLVQDRVGLVTPRIICMIINEAYFTVQEGTATRDDIDMAMKLGTNYPYGPFEWCKRIGIRQVYEVLQAVYEDTKDERYKICPLLKKEYFES